MKERWKKWIGQDSVRLFLFWLGALLLWEAVLHGAVGQGLDRFWPGLAFSCGGAALLAGLTALPGVGWATDKLLVGGAFFLYAGQMVYNGIFGSFLSLAYVGMGGDAMSDFMPLALSGIRKSAGGLAMLALPLVVLFILRRRGYLPKRTGLDKPRFAVAAAGVLVCVCMMPAALGATGATATVDQWVERFGLLTAEALDLRRLYLGGGGPAGDGLDLTAGTGRERNVLEEVDFGRLEELPREERLRELDHYFGGLRGTGKNENTGRFEGYNLILICAESYSPYLVDPVLTPTLYRLSTEGILFQNFYNSFPNLTTNGEYALCMGLMPDMSRMSFATSVNNFLPFCLGRVFSGAGVEARAYHNGNADFYNRLNTHTNMGYRFSAIGAELDMVYQFPTSDLEMMEKTVDDYIAEKPFFAYYMTFSGHGEYTFSGNAISRQNRELVEDMELSEELQAFYACQLELERALAYLLERLEEAGVAERTVIALTGDHLPYYLSEENYALLAGEEWTQEPFWQYRNSFLCWNGGMEEPLVVEEYCCSQDILPTLLNLFGFPYDSRLLTGRDVLSDCTHAAVLADGSFLTRELVYDGTADRFSWRGEEGSEDYAQALRQAVEDQFSAAAAILDTDYYGSVFSDLEIEDISAGRTHYASFGDIEGTWYEEEVEFLVSYNILEGNFTGAFMGEDPSTRAQLLAMLHRVLGYTEAAEEVPFADVEMDQWYAGPIAVAWKAGLLSEEDFFHPLEPLTEEEAAALLDVCAQRLGMEETEEWAMRTVERAASTQGSEGVPPGEEGLTRGATALMLADLLRDSGFETK